MRHEEYSAKYRLDQVTLRKEDENIWLTVWKDNEYDVPERFAPDSVVLDIGAHVGAFTYMAAERGAGTVLAFEASPLNFTMLSNNTSRWPQVQVKNIAVWRSDISVESVNLCVPVGDNSGGFSCAAEPVEGGAYEDHVWVIPAISLDSVLEGLEKVDFMKIDCEGSEWPILLTSKLLAQKVKYITGEYHQFLSAPPAHIALPGHEKGFFIEDLVQHLWGLGYTVTFQKVNEILGQFQAVKEE